VIESHGDFFYINSIDNSKAFYINTMYVIILFIKIHTLCKDQCLQYKIDDSFPIPIETTILFVAIISS